MSEQTKIQWCDHTFNPWSGCTKVSAECDRCYAEVNYSVKMRGVKWGKYGNRIIKADSGWKDPFKWNKMAEIAGIRRRVFCASLADVFEGNESMPETAWDAVADARRRLFETIEGTPHLDWLLLTKRPQRVNPFLDQVEYALPGNVWIGTSVGVAKTKDRIDYLREVEASIRFLSIEPLLEDLGKLNLKGIDWVIIGGESGNGSRPCNIDWMRSIVRQAKEQGCKVFVKQLGSGRTEYGKVHVQPVGGNGVQADSWTYSDPKGGDIDEFPAGLKIREFPA